MTHLPNHITQELEIWDKQFPDVTHTSCADKSIKCGTMAESQKSHLTLAIKRVTGKVLSELAESVEGEKIQLDESNKIIDGYYNQALDQAIELINQRIKE